MLCNIEILNYALPQASWANGWSKWLVNDWQVSSVMNFHTGQPCDEVLSYLNQVGEPYRGD